MALDQSVRLARKHAKKQDWRQAQVVLGHELQRHPKNKRLLKESRVVSQALANQHDPTGPDRDELVSLFTAQNFQQIVAQGHVWAERYPNSPLVWKILATTYSKSGHLNMSLKCFDQALRLAPVDVESLLGIAGVLNALGQTREAIVFFERILCFYPDNLPALNNLANACRVAGDLQRAAQIYEQAREITSHINLDIGYLAVLLLQERLEDAAALIANLDTETSGPDLWRNLATFHQLKGNLPEAAAFFEKIAEQDAENVGALVSAITARNKMGDWSWRAKNPDLTDNLRVSDAVVQPHQALSLFDDPTLQHDLSTRYAAAQFPKVDRAQFVPPDQMPEKIRVGYFSNDFYNHATMHLMRGLFEEHDSERFEVCIYSYSAAQTDRYQAALRTQAALFRDVETLSDAQIAAIARDDGLHIGIDLKGHTGGSRSAIFAYGTAPVQVAWIGYPGTSGHACFDYAIVDPVVVPESGRSGFSENLIYLPDCYQVNDNIRPREAEDITRKSEGLPEDAFVFSCFNNSYKISPVEFDIWMNLLREREDSVLWLLNQNAWFVANMRKEAETRGVDPDRIYFAEFCPPTRNIARQGLADLFLDTFNYNAHTTASDALWGGLPVLTMQGQQFSARVASSLLHCLGLPELITTSPEDYAQKALELSQDVKLLNELRDRLEQNRAKAPLFDTRQFARALESRLTQVYARFQQNNPLTDVI